MFHRYFHGRVNELALRMENEALRFMAAMDKEDGTAVQQGGDS
jgi:hypothetical protein